MGLDQSPTNTSPASSSPTKSPTTSAEAAGTTAGQGRDALVVAEALRAACAATGRLTATVDPALVKAAKAWLNRAAHVFAKRHMADAITASGQVLFWNDPKGVIPKIVHRSAVRGGPSRVLPGKQRTNEWLITPIRIPAKWEPHSVALRSGAVRSVEKTTFGGLVSEFDRRIATARTGDKPITLAPDANPTDGIGVLVRWLGFLASPPEGWADHAIPTFAWEEELRDLIASLNLDSAGIRALHTHTTALLFSLKDAQALQRHLDIEGSPAPEMGADPEAAAALQALEAWLVEAGLPNTLEQPLAEDLRGLLWEYEWGNRPEPPSVGPHGTNRPGDLARARRLFRRASFPVEHLVQDGPVRAHSPLGMSAAQRADLNVRTETTSHLYRGEVTARRDWHLDLAIALFRLPEVEDPFIRAAAATALLENGRDTLPDLASHATMTVGGAEWERLVALAGIDDRPLAYHEASDTLSVLVPQEEAERRLRATSGAELDRIGAEAGAEVLTLSRKLNAIRGSVWLDLGADLGSGNIDGAAEGGDAEGAAPAALMALPRMSIVKPDGEIRADLDLTQLPEEARAHIDAAYDTLLDQLDGLSRAEPEATGLARYRLAWMGEDALVGDAGEDVIVGGSEDEALIGGGSGLGSVGLGSVGPGAENQPGNVALAQLFLRGRTRHVFTLGPKDPPVRDKWQRRDVTYRGPVDGVPTPALFTAIAMTTVPNDANEPGDLRLRGRIISELHGGEADADIRTRATLSYGSDAWRALEAAAGLSPDEVRAVGDTVTLFRPFTSKEAERMHDVDTQNRLGLTEKIQRLLKDLNQRYHVRTGCAVGVERVGRGDPLAGDGNGVLAVRPIANLVDDDTGQLGLPNNSAEKLAVVAPRTLAWLLEILSIAAGEDPALAPGAGDRVVGGRLHIQPSDPEEPAFVDIYDSNVADAMAASFVAGFIDTIGQFLKGMAVLYADGATLVNLLAEVEIPQMPAEREETALAALLEGTRATPEQVSGVMLRYRTERAAKSAQDAWREALGYDASLARALTVSPQSLEAWKAGDRIARKAAAQYEEAKAGGNIPLVWSMYVVGQNILAFGAVPAGAAAGAGVGGAVGAVPGAAVGAAAGTVAGGAAGVAFSAIAALGETDSYVHAAVSVAFDVKIAAMLVDLLGALLGKLSKLLGEAAETGAKRVVEEGGEAAQTAALGKSGATPEAITAQAKAVGATAQTTGHPLAAAALESAVSTLGKMTVGVVIDVASGDRKIDSVGTR